MPAKEIHPSTKNAVSSNEVDDRSIGGVIYSHTHEKEDLYWLVLRIRDIVANAFHYRLTMCNAKIEKLCAFNAAIST